MTEARPDKPIAAFVVSLLGGIWMILASLLWSIGGGMGRMPHDGHIPHHRPGTNDGMGWMHRRGLLDDFAPDFTWWPWIGLVAGVLVILGAVMVYTRPDQRVSWGVTILIAATVSLFFGAGGVLGAILAIIGGVLALTWRPSSPPEQPRS